MQDMLVMTMESARNIVHRQTMNMHNLANISTDGFRKEIALVETMESGDELTSAPDFSQGAIRVTGRNLDVAISGEGWFEVVAPDGTTAYSRRGDLHVDELGQLRNGARQQLVGDGGPIVIPPHSQIAIGNDGTISILPEGERPSTMAAIDRIKLVNPNNADLERSNDGLFRLKPGAEAPTDATLQLLPGALEGSNVNAVEALVTMIELARAFEANVKMLSESKTQMENLARVVALG